MNTQTETEFKTNKTEASVFYTLFSAEDRGTKRYDNTFHGFIFDSVRIKNDEIIIKYEEIVDNETVSKTLGSVEDYDFASPNSNEISEALVDKDLLLESLEATKREAVSLMLEPEIVENYKIVFKVAPFYTKENIEDYFLEEEEEAD